MTMPLTATRVRQKRPARPVVALGVAAIVLCMWSCAPAYAAHPLLTEDTDTQGSGHWQVELTTDQEHINGPQSVYGSLTTVALTRGLSDDADIILTQAHVESEAPPARGGATQGFADLAIDLKWRLIQQGPWALAVKPGIGLPTGAQSQSAGRTTYGLFMVASYQPRPWRLLLHGGHLHYANILHERRELWHASAAVVWDVSDLWQLVADGGTDTETDPEAGRSITFVTAGAIYAVHKNMNLDIGYRHTHTAVSRAEALLAGVALRW
jgi:hypothetical protein